MVSDQIAAELYEAGETSFQAEGFRVCNVTHRN